MKPQGIILRVEGHVPIELVYSPYETESESTGNLGGEFRVP